MKAAKAWACWGTFSGPAVVDGRFDDSFDIWYADITLRAAEDK